MDNEAVEQRPLPTPDRGDPELDFHRAIATLVRVQRISRAQATELQALLSQRSREFSQQRAKTVELLYLLACGAADGTLTAASAIAWPREGVLAVHLRQTLQVLEARPGEAELPRAPERLMIFAKDVWPDVVLEVSARVLVGGRRCRAVLLGTEPLSSLVRIPVPFR